MSKILLKVSTNQVEKGNSGDDNEDLLRPRVTESMIPQKEAKEGHAEDS